MFGVKKRKGRFEAPHVFVILFTLIIAASIMTYLIPAGHFERVELGGRMVIDPESFVYVEQTPVGIFAALNCITAGIGEVSEIIAFLLIMGGSFHVIQSTDAIKIGIGRIAVAGAKSGRDKFLIPVLMAAFAAGGVIRCRIQNAFQPICGNLCTGPGIPGRRGHGRGTVQSGSRYPDPGKYNRYNIIQLLFPVVPDSGGSLQPGDLSVPMPFKFPDPVRFRPGSRFNPYFSPSGRFNRRDETDNCRCLPAWRCNLQYTHADFGILYGSFVSCQYTVGKMGKMDSSPDWTAISGRCCCRHDCPVHPPWAILKSFNIIKIRRAGCVNGKKRN